MKKTKRTKNGISAFLALRGFLAAIGVISAPTGASAALSFEVATSENTAEAYTAFILGGGDPELVDEAFCRLSGVDASAAENVAASYAADTSLGVSFEPCATTGSARLFTI